MLTKNTKLIKNCKPALLKLFRKDLKKYIELFFWEKEVSGPEDSDIFDVLEKAGLISKHHSAYSANVMVYPLKDKFIITDFIFVYPKFMI